MSILFSYNFPTITVEDFELSISPIMLGAKRNRGNANVLNPSPEIPSFIGDIKQSQVLSFSAASNSTTQDLICKKLRPTFTTAVSVFVSLRLQEAQKAQKAHSKLLSFNEDSLPKSLVLRNQVSLPADCTAETTAIEEVLKKASQAIFKEVQKARKKVFEAAVAAASPTQLIADIKAWLLEALPLYLANVHDVPSITNGLSKIAVPAIRHAVRNFEEQVAAKTLAKIEADKAKEARSLAAAAAASKPLASVAEIVAKEVKLQLAKALGNGPGLKALKSAAVIGKGRKKKATKPSIPSSSPSGLAKRKVSFSRKSTSTKSTKPALQSILKKKPKLPPTSKPSATKSGGNAP